MINTDNIVNIYLAQGATDLRCGIDGYAHIVQDAMGLEVFDSQSIYIFCNRQHNKIKILVLELNGFWLMYKRLEKGTFKWPREDGKNISISIDYQFI